MAASKQFYAISLPDSTLSNDENSNRDNGNKNDDSSLVNLSPQGNNKIYLFTFM